MSDRWLNRRTTAWASYDIASSVYFGAAPAVLMPLYFHQLMRDFENATAGWGAIASVAILASGLAALTAASLAGRMRRFTLLVLFSVGLLASVAALAWNPWSSLLVAAVAYVAAQSFYFASSTVYESFLPDLLPPAQRQKLSGFGWAIGYIGGILGIVVLLNIVAGQPESADLLELCFGALAFISVVLFALVLSAMRSAGFAQLGEAAGAAPRLSGVWTVMSHWRHHSSVLRLLVGTMMVQAAISAVVTFTAPILAERFGQSLRDLLWLLLLIHILSVPSTFCWSLLTGSWSRMVAMAVLLLAWGVVLLLLAFGSGPWMPLATVSVIGCCLGATASSLRGSLAEAVETGSSAAFFGLSTVAGRVASALGPAFFALVSPWGGQAAALLVILAVLALGGSVVLNHMLRKELPTPARAGT